MDEIDWFPLGIAEGRAFCDREKERTQLKRNFNSLTHTLIHSPRRYGKTSLALQSVKEAKYAIGLADFMTASDDISTAEIILRSVSQAISNLLPIHKLTLNKISKYLRSLSASIVISERRGARIELTPIKTLTVNSISEMLLDLDELALKEKKKVVLLFDEFQQVLSLKNSHAIEGAIRHVAQQTKASSYMFSGSNRHLLLKMFDDSTRPLFHLCNRIELTRIPADYYIDYLNEASKARWRKMLPNEVINEILELTQRHPYFLNSLCKMMWYEEKQVADRAEVRDYFRQLCEEEHTRISYDLSTLSSNQRAVLVVLAQEKTKTPQSREFITESRVALSSVAQAIHVLKKKNFIYINDEGIYCITDPVMDALIS